MTDRPAAPEPPVALTVAGSDSGGCAGIQADLHTFAAHAVHGTAVVTALTAQNTTGVTAARSSGPDLVAAQLDAVLVDFDVAAVKTGMLADAETLAVVADHASRGRLPNLVVDPVMITTSGDPLFTGSPAAYLAALGPAATVITPNLPEAEALLGTSISSLADMRDAARALAAFGPQAVIVKGGHAIDTDRNGPLDDAERGARPIDDAAGASVVDVLWCDGRMLDLTAPRVDTRNVHGTGCTLSAAIAARLAHGHPVAEACAAAKTYVTEALRSAATWRLGAGPGPVHHHHGLTSTTL